MSDQTAGSSQKDLPLTTRLSIENTRGSYERTMMSWIRTGTSLITFGFAVYKFFQFEAPKISEHEPLIKTVLFGPREFGMLMIGIGLLALLLGTFEHRRDLRALRKDYPGMPSSATSVIAVLIATLGLLAFVGVVYRF